jgi:hypothetical protein
MTNMAATWAAHMQVSGSAGLTGLHFPAIGDPVLFFTAAECL